MDGIGTDQSTSSAADFVQNRCCAVCSGVGASIFCAVFSCRPCASFFRRSVKERREYICRANNKCPIDRDGMRNCCRACRLRRCFQAGMLADFVSNGGGSANHSEPKLAGSSGASSLEKYRPKHAIIDDGTISVIRSPLPSPLISNSVDGSFAPQPFINRFSQSLREFCEGQKAICAQQFGIGTLFGNKLRPITQEEYSTIDRGCVVLLINFVRTHIPQIDSVPTQQKVNILKNFTFHFNVLQSCKLTLKHWPLEEQHQLVILPGCLFELEQFCTTVTGPGKQHQMAFARQYLERFFHFMIHSFKPLSITPTEFAALQGIQLWKYVGECIEMASDFGTDHPLDAIFFELHSVIAASHGGANSKNAAIRFGRILSMLTQISELSRQMEELFTLCKVFLDPGSCVNTNDHWDAMFAEEKIEANKMNK